MKRALITSLVLLALLAMTAGTAFAGSALELRSVGNNQGGPTFVFRVTGEFSDEELSSGFVQVQGGEDFPLYCSQTSPTEVVCHTSKKVGGHDVVVGFGGARFWTYVKEQFIHTSQYCYSVWDYWAWTGNDWFNYGPQCQEEPASLGDQTSYFVFNAPGGGFDFGPLLFYDYDHALDDCGDVIAYDGPAYYFPGCP